MINEKLKKDLHDSRMENGRLLIRNRELIYLCEEHNIPWYKWEGGEQ